MLNLTGSMIGLKETKEPKEGRQAINLLSPSTNAPMSFSAANEVYQFSSESIRSPQKLSQILTLWIDASQVPAGKNIYVNSGSQKLQITGGSQGYYAVSVAMPANFIINSDNNTVGTLGMIAYNYEVVPGQSQTVVTVSGAITANVNQINGAAISLGQKTSANSIPIVIASDQSPIAISDSVSLTGGASTFGKAVTNAAQAVKAAAGKVYAILVGNNNAAISYLQLFDLATGNVNLGVTVPLASILIPANSSTVIPIIPGMQFNTAISCAGTTTRGGNTAPGTALDVNIIYN